MAFTPLLYIQCNRKVTAILACALAALAQVSIRKGCQLSFKRKRQQWVWGCAATRMHGRWKGLVQVILAGPVTCACEVLLFINTCY